MAQAPRSMFGGFFGNPLKVAPSRSPLGNVQAPMAPTQYQAASAPLQRPPAAAPAPAPAQMPGFARTANGPVPMGAKGDCPICH